MNDLFAICLFLVSFFFLNVALTLATIASWRFIDVVSLNWSAKRRAKFIFALRVFPTAFSALLLFLFFVPSFLIYEENNPHEFVSFKLGALAFLSFVSLLWAFGQSSLSLLRTRKQISKWEREAARLNLESTSLPVYKIKYDFPIIAVVGFFKPKVFIDEKVFELLNENELAAVVAHEQAHVESQDNWKRLALNFCAALFPFGKKIDIAWENSAEASADECSAKEKRTRPLDLAFALVKLARVMSENTETKMVASYISTNWQAPVAWRVYRLIKLANGFSQKEEQPLFSGFSILIIAFGLAVTFLLAVTQTDLFAFIHHLIEVFVKFLI